MVFVSTDFLKSSALAILFFIPSQSFAEGSVEYLNPVSKAVSQMGDTQCADRVGQVIDFIGFDEKSAVALLTQRDQPKNQRIIPVIMEQTDESGTALISTTFAPSKNGCVATYDAITVWNSSCNNVAANNFSQLTRSRMLKSNVKVLDGGDHLKIFLMQAGPICLVLKKEVVD